LGVKPIGLREPAFTLLPGFSRGVTDPDFGLAGLPGKLRWLDLALSSWLSLALSDTSRCLLLELPSPGAIVPLFGVSDLFRFVGVAGKLPRTPGAFERLDGEPLDLVGVLAAEPRLPLPVLEFPERGDDLIGIERLVILEILSFSGLSEAILRWRRADLAAGSDLDSFALRELAQLLERACSRSSLLVEGDFLRGDVKEAENSVSEAFGFGVDAFETLEELWNFGLFDAFECARPALGELSLGFVGVTGVIIAGL
jgi:hypothetical protein